MCPALLSSYQLICLFCDITEDLLIQPLNSPGGSSTSSRDGSPSRDISPLTRNLKPPLVIKKGPQGFGFRIQAIRVYLGDTDLYTLQHMVVVSISSLHYFLSFFFFVLVGEGIESQAVQNLLVLDSNNIRVDLSSFASWNGLMLIQSTLPRLLSVGIVNMYI